MFSSSAGALACDLTRDMAANVRNYFQNPERNTASELMRQLETACGAGNGVLVRQRSLQLLAMVETAAHAGRGANLTAGSNLVNALLACMSTGGCTQAAWPGIDFVAALSNSTSDAALFAVRWSGVFGLPANDAMPAMARGVVDFTDFDNKRNHAQWGIGLARGVWSVATGDDFVVLYGAPKTGSNAGPEQTFGGLAFSFNRYPHNGPFSDDDLVQVGACFNFEFEMPHDHHTGRSTRPLVQRRKGQGGEVLLAPVHPGFCPGGNSTQPRTASAFAPLNAVVRSLLPAHWFFRAVNDVRVPVVGGSALDFSDFTPLAADPEGKLEWEHTIPSVVTLGGDLNPITVHAYSGGGQPLEGVTVRISVENNKGSPAGAILVPADSTVKTTSGDLGTVVFFGGLNINKTGGYTVCATAQAEGFTFPKRCTDLFHVRK